MYIYFDNFLRYIEWALHHDPNFEKGKRIREKIFEEHPYLSPDPEVQKRKPIPRPIECKPRSSKKVPETKQLTVHKLKFLDLIQCIVKEYNDGGEGRMKDITLPISVEFKEPVEENHFEVEMTDIKGVMDDILDKVEATAATEEKMEVDEPEKTDEELMALSILDEMIIKLVDYSRIKSIVNGVAGK